MIRISLEIRDGTRISTTSVQAESVREAVGIAKERYPGHRVRVVFPIDPENFFVGGAGGAGRDLTRTMSG